MDIFAHGAEPEMGWQAVPLAAAGTALAVALGLLAVLVVTERKARLRPPGKRKVVEHRRAQMRARGWLITGIAAALTVSAFSFGSARETITRHDHTVTAVEASPDPTERAKGSVALRLRFTRSRSDGDIALEVRNPVARSMFAQCSIEALGSDGSSVVQGEFTRVDSAGNIVAADTYTTAFSLGPRERKRLEVGLSISDPVESYSGDCEEIVTIPDEWSLNTQQN